MKLNSRNQSSEIVPLNAGFHDEGLNDLDKEASFLLDQSTTKIIKKKFLNKRDNNGY